MAEDGPVYTCDEVTDVTCAETCVSLEACMECGCAVLQDEGGPWGSAMDVIFCLLPIVFLLVVTLKPKPMATTLSLPLAALLMFLVRLMYLGSDPLLTSGSVIAGAHEALTPLSIMAGAMSLFEVMEATNCMPFMMREMKALTKGHPVAELMILFSFAYMVEGASGFGTPVALGAPMLISLGHPKLESVVVLLLMNTFATVWGAAGTPIWFGFGGLGLTEDEFIEISYKAAVCIAIAAYLLLPFVLSIMVPKTLLNKNRLFIAASLSTCVLPSLGLSFAFYEFPALIGGLVGCIGTSVLIHYRVGLSQHEPDELLLETGRHPMEIASVCEESIVHDYRKQQSVDFSVSTKGPAQEIASTESKPITNPNGMAQNDIEIAENDNPVDPVGSKKEADENLGRGVSFDDPVETIEATEDAGDGIVSFDDDEALKRKNEVDRERSIFQRQGTSMSDAVTTDSLRAVEDHFGPRKAVGEGYVKELLLRTFPIWGTILILFLTRVEQIGIKELLQRTDPHFSIYFGTYGTFEMSASLVVSLKDILTYPGLSWTYALLYVPFLVPFILMSALTVFIFRKELTRGVGKMRRNVLGRLVGPAKALVGALILVELMLNGGEASPASLIGTTLSEAMAGGWIAIAGFIGVLGSFFSGSTTISNLTFGNIQMIAAENIGTSTTSLLALQACGASAGNGVCLNNIIAACAIVGLTNVGEGTIIAKTYKYVLGFVVIATIGMLIFFLRF
eukprot:CAMPEP_0198285058 /NCGR_PEP_ID=MMETSP1449-20131203/4371_1 /TAXON_ID=420275 /ORGANISM="Attheya septentrionalis, Strain CCMP2084" /LENGTH=733 /DNA_ID=CAMNT_0043982303 /DNA_START=124 /DNA_END=2325 /DNA_ORIENTATION=+